MNKFCTDVQQYTQLIELGIDEDTADSTLIKGDSQTPAWSLPALLDLFPCSKDSPIFNLTRGGWNPSFTRDWYATWEDDDRIISVSADNPVDAVVKLIIQIHQTTDKL